MSRASSSRPRFLKDPRAFCASSSLAPMVWLSYLLPAVGRRSSGRSDREEPSHVAGLGLVSSDRPVVTPSRKISLMPSLARILGSRIQWRWSWETPPGATVVGWGYRLSGRRALATATRKSGTPVLVEDGFLRSVDRYDAPIGLNLDSRGIHYDASSPSRLFDLARQPLTHDQAERARRIVALWRAHALSKYNGSPDHMGDLPERYVLVVDQVRDDLAIRHSGATPGSFATMLEAALEHDPDTCVVVKIHPDTAAKPEKSHYDLQALAGRKRVMVIDDACHVASLIAGAEAVYTVSSQVGFEALLHGKDTHVFAMPFYAGWGLTTDATERPAGRCDIPLEQLVHAALVDYPRYFHPALSRPIEVEEAMALIGLNRRLRKQWPKVIHASGFSAWKRPFIRQFLAGSTVRFTSATDAPDGATVLLWGRAQAPSSRPDLTILRIEDGFLRSSGLGADLTRPLSLVIDDVGIYYDATRPSRLEHILQSRDYTPQECRRAARLRSTIVAQRLSKYNLGGTNWTRPEEARHVILVVGQVEDDASIDYGSPEIRSDLALVRRVREENPDAYLLYKPHPDVVAGLRAVGTDADVAARLCDKILTHADPVALLDEVDEVHVMTSLLGFEALLRGKKVTCHGLPFYAGWGLTDDRLPSPRRTRTRTLDELVHAVLIDYPRYVSAKAGLFVSPEEILVELAEMAAAGPASAHPLRKALRPVLGLWSRRRRRRR